MKPYLNYFAQFLNSGNPSSWNKTRSCFKNIQAAINSKSICILWWLVLSHKINVLLERGKMFREQALATQPPERPLATGSLDWSRSYHSPRHWLAEEKSTYIRSATNAALKEYEREMHLHRSLRASTATVLCTPKNCWSTRLSPVPTLTLPFGPYSIKPIAHIRTWEDPQGCLLHVPLGSQSSANCCWWPNSTACFWSIIWAVWALVHQLWLSNTEHTALTPHQFWSVVWEMHETAFGLGLFFLFMFHFSTLGKLMRPLTLY